jgi:plasmid stabilization system protein ParE
MKVRYSKLALDELEVILSRISAENPSAATRLEAGISRIVERIGRFPESAQEVAERQGVRRVPLVRYPYAIYYRVVSGEVIILRVVHGARRDPWEEI